MICSNRECLTFFSLRPAEDPKDGTWGKRTLSAVFKHWAENIKHSCRKFNAALNKVDASKPTGVTEDQQIKMAVAIHLEKNRYQVLSSERF